MDSYSFDRHFFRRHRYLSVEPATTSTTAARTNERNSIVFILRGGLVLARAAIDALVARTVRETAIKFLHRTDERENLSFDRFVFITSIIAQLQQESMTSPYP